MTTTLPDISIPFRRAVGRGTDPELAWDDSEWFRALDKLEHGCREYLEILRWSGSVECLRCHSLEVTRLAARKRFCCRRCKYQFSVTSGTVMHNSHAPLWKWFLAVRLLLEAEEGLPANQLARHLGGSYKTAWFIEHRVRAAVAAAQPAHVPARRTAIATAVTGTRFYDRAVVGPYHQQGVDYLGAYRAEREWRLRNLRNPDRFRDTLRALLEAGPLSYAALVRPPGRTESVAVRHANRPERGDNGDPQVFLSV
jgi:transposase-like protein